MDNVPKDNEFPSRSYYTVEIRICGTAPYCIWFSDDTDGLVWENGRIRLFQTTAHLQEYAQRSGITVEPEVTVCDFEQLDEWLQSDGRNINCSDLLDFWNFIADCTAGSEYSFLGSKRIAPINKLYDKLFYGCNLPAIKGDKPDYIPTWSKSEIDRLMKIFADGYSIAKELFCNPCFEN